MNKKMRVASASILTFMMLSVSMCAGWDTAETIEVSPKPAVQKEYVHVAKAPVLPKEALIKDPKPVVVKTKQTPKAEVKPKEKVASKPALEPQKGIKLSVSEADMRLIAHMTMAEAEGESEYGQRLVIDTILNRVDSEQFPDSVQGVIYQPYQFSSINDGRFGRCYVKDDIYQLVIEEVQSRTNSSVIFFRTGRYSDYGTPMIKEGAHYFSSI